MGKGAREAAAIAVKESALGALAVAETEANEVETGGCDIRRVAAGLGGDDGGIVVVVVVAVVVGVVVIVAGVVDAAAEGAG